MNPDVGRTLFFSYSPGKEVGLEKSGFWVYPGALGSAENPGITDASKFPIKKGRVFGLYADKAVKSYCFRDATIGATVSPDFVGIDSGWVQIAAKDNKLEKIIEPVKHCVVSVWEQDALSSFNTKISEDKYASHNLDKFKLLWVQLKDCGAKIYNDGSYSTNLAVLPNAPAGTILLGWSKPAGVSNSMKLTSYKFYTNDIVKDITVDVNTNSFTFEVAKEYKLNICAIYNNDATKLFCGKELVVVGPAADEGKPAAAEGLPAEIVAVMSEASGLSISKATVYQPPLKLEKAGENWESVSIVWQSVEEIDDMPIQSYELEFYTLNPNGAKLNLNHKNVAHYKNEIVWGDVYFDFGFPNPTGMEYLLPELEYNFDVAVVYKDKNDNEIKSEYSEPLKYTVPSLPKPTNLSIKETDAPDVLSLTWDLVGTSGYVKEYQVELYKGEGDISGKDALMTLKSSEKSAKFSELTPGAKYSIAIKAVYTGKTGDLLSDYSDVLHYTLPPVVKSISYDTGPALQEENLSLFYTFTSMKVDKFNVSYDYNGGFTFIMQGEPKCNTTTDGKKLCFNEGSPYFEVYIKDMNEAQSDPYKFRSLIRIFNLPVEKGKTYDFRVKTNADAVESNGFDLKDVEF